MPTAKVLAGRLIKAKLLLAARLIIKYEIVKEGDRISYYSVKEIIKVARALVKENPTLCEWMARHVYR